MTSGYRIIPFDPKTASEDEWQHFFEIRDTLFRETHPEDPLPPREILRNFLLGGGLMSEDFFWLAFPEGKDRIAGRVQSSFLMETMANYEANKHVAQVQLGVAPEHRRKGLGSELLRVAAQAAHARGKSVLQASANSEPGFVFCEQLGGDKVIEAATNRLRLADVDWEMIEAWRAEGPQRAPGVTLHRYDEGLPDDIAHYAEVYTEVMMQQPLGELEGVDMVLTPDFMRQMQERLLSLGAQWIALVARESDGAVSAITDIQYLPESSYKITQMLTGVRQQYRGRGLGKWVKAEMLLYIREAYPGVRFIDTGNADVNAPMLSINNRMGFKRFLEERTYKFQLGELMQTLGMAAEAATQD
jgi:GNAT superfamily N-acetyltransferase